MAKQRLCLRRKAKVAAVFGQEKRSNSKAVAREEQLARKHVPYGESKVAVQAFEAGLPPLCVRMHEDFRVACGRKARAERLELVAEFDVVVDLPVLDDPVASVLTRQRLVAVSEVDDGEPRR